MNKTIKVRLTFKELVTVSEVVEMKREDYELYQKTHEMSDLEKNIVSEGLVTRYKPKHFQVIEEEVKPESITLVRQS